MYEEGIFEKEDLSERVKSLSNQIKCNLKERDKLQQSVSEEQIEPIDYKLVKRVLAKFNQVLTKVENEKKKLILNLVIQKLNWMNIGNYRGSHLHLMIKLKSIYLMDKRMLPYMEHPLLVFQ